MSNPNIDETVLRTVGLISIQSDQAAAQEEQIGAFGMIVVNDLAVAAGAASIPGPITDRGDDGWHLYVPFAQTLSVATVVGFHGNFATQYGFDSKAKRRVEEGSQIAIMVENAHATHGLLVSFVFRMLSQVSGT